MSTPTNCPFCGAGHKVGFYSNTLWKFDCGTITASDLNRDDQTPQCITAEVARLTRERDEARERAAEMTFQAADAQLKHEAATRDLASVTKERDDWKRVAEGMNAFMERARAKTTNTRPITREWLECLREYDAVRAAYEAQRLTISTDGKVVGL